MEPNAQAAPAAATEPNAAGAAAPIAQDQASQQPAQQPAADVKLGTQENPVIVPAGTQDALQKLSEGGWKPEDIDAYLGSIQDEELRQHIKDSIEGKGTMLQESDPAPDPDNAPFTDEELEKLDPAIASRLRLVQESLLSSIEAAEKHQQELEAARGEIPPQLQRLLQDPVLKARQEELERGETYLVHFNETYFNEESARLLQAGDLEGLKAHLAEIPAVIAEIARRSRAEATEEFEQKAAIQEKRNALANYFEVSLTKVTGRQEFKSSEPELLADGNPNPKNPASAFAMYLYGGLADGSLTMQSIEYMGGIEKLAMSWIADRKGGIGNLAQEAERRGMEGMKQRLLQGRAKALGAGTAQSLSVSSAASARPLVHGVDIDLAISDPSYAAKVSKSLSDEKRSEVVKAILERSGMTNSR